MVDEDDSDYLASCHGKERHTASMARQIVKRYPQAVIYKCSFCQQHHIGHRQSKPKKTLKSV